MASPLACRLPLVATALVLAQERLPALAREEECGVVEPESSCDYEVKWAREHGIYDHPEWYEGLNPKSTYEEFQRWLHNNGHGACPLPCTVPTTPAPFAYKVPELDELNLPCKLGHNESLDHYREVYRLNCVKVRETVAEFKMGSRRAQISQIQAERWDRAAEDASELCEASKNAALSGREREAALLAVQAWAIGIMDGSQCCILVHPPYCLQTTWSSAIFSIHTPVGVLTFAMCLVFLSTAILSCIERTREHYVSTGAIPYIEEFSAASTTPLPTGTVGHPARGHLEELLLSEWMQRSSLRLLPGGQAFATSSASLFAALQEKFDFQVDSCRNQFEHLISLWRSHSAMVADRSIGTGADVDEEDLLVEGLRDLHQDLLDGFRSWRAKFDPALGYSKANAKPTLGGAIWTPVLAHGHGSWTADEAVELSCQLAEIAAYLLVWGEAGNLRFMPEVIYFVTSLVLTAEADPARPGCVLGEQAVRGRSGLFLVKVVRPLYSVVFDAWYKYVKVETQYLVDNDLLRSVSSGLHYCFSKDSEDVDLNREPAAWGSTVKGLPKAGGWLKVPGERYLPMEVRGKTVLTPKSGRDKWREIKRLKKGFDCYLPADVANYDDWDEFFHDPARLSEGLFMPGNKRLFDLPCGQRFAALPRVNWALSLRPSATKTHREVHSLWGVYATSHRIWLLHAVLFLIGVCSVTGEPPSRARSRVVVGGRTGPLRFAAVGLVSPLHTLFWAYARWMTLSYAAIRRCGWRQCGILSCLMNFLEYTMWVTLWFSPIFTYAAVRYLEAYPDREVPGNFSMTTCLVAHYTVSLLGLLSHLLIPGSNVDRLWKFTPEPIHIKAARYSFWLIVLGCKFLLGLYVAQAVFQATQNLNLVSPGHESITEIYDSCVNTDWGGSVLQWLVLWCMTFWLYITDTQLWFTAGCTVLGVVITFAQRRCKFWFWATEDAHAKIPQRFSEKVLPYTRFDNRNMSEKFPEIWNEIVENLYTEDKCKNTFEKGDLCFGAVRRKLFLHTSAVERLARQWCGLRDDNGLHNSDMQWRINALARGLGLPIPRPFRAPYIPGITVLIPNYGETIIMKKGELYNDGKEETVPLVDWLTTRYTAEFEAFVNRMDKAQASREATDAIPGLHTAYVSDWPEAGSNWSEYRDHHWEKICTWASMRMQTLYRTVAGMVLYHRALQCHFEAQGIKDCAFGRTWSPSDCFTCMVAMQSYKTFDASQLSHTNKLFAKCPPSLKVAFIDWEDKDHCAETDAVHPRQERRYFSCLIDASCTLQADGRREPKFRVELPGFAILGDGKGDNQNHAIPFMRGTFAQCIDSNQGAYLEQMLLLPCVLGEFRTQNRGDNGSKRIIGLPEHITSDFGSIGDFAAGSEVAFGTILQRSYWVLGARMHYGHPDIMNKEFMMQQGGVSKATKTLNLSEDIFAGMDFVLRGGGRRIRHCEYFHLAKGRDLGFNTVLGFFSKLSSGAGEQIITRQMFRLGQLLSLPEFMTFYYAHVGYYITQAFISWSIPIVIFTWLLLLMSDCEDTFRAFMNCPEEGAAIALGRMLSIVYSWLLFAFCVATSLPLFIEQWMERGLKAALARALMQYMTLSPFLFIFQAKIIGYYITNELRYGGATYVSTGRGLPTERRPFIGNPDGKSGFRIKDKDVGGLYLDYAVSTYYDGMILLTGVLLVVYLGGSSRAGAYDDSLAFTWLATSITLVSWLYAPFLFNPYQFSSRFFRKDLRAWVAFFFQEGGCKWINWYETKIVKPGAGLHKSVGDISFVLGFVALAAVFSNMYRKLRVFAHIYSTFPLTKTLQVVTLIPPIILSVILCIILSIGEGLCHASARKPNKKKMKQLSRDEEATSSGSEDSEEIFVTKRRCRVPLALCAMAVFILNVAEGIAPLLIVLDYNWKKAFVAGLVLKFMLSQAILSIAESLLRHRCRCKPKRERCLSRPLQLWVHSNRMAWDLITSTFLFWTLVPLVLANSLNDWLAPGLNVHQLLIYRAAHLSPQQLDKTVFKSCCATDGGRSGGSSSGDENSVMRPLI